jgi:uncharacterized membrane protein YgdD (TMEM256/DUF423 family)
MTRISRVLIGLSGAAAVGFGAFAAHGIDDEMRRAWMQTGATYQMVHTLAAWAALSSPRAGATPLLFGFGILVFSGCLYAMGLGAPRWLGAVVPIGGVSFILGWLSFAWTGVRGGNNQP